MAGAATHGYLQGQQPRKIERMKVGKPYFTGMTEDASHSRILRLQREGENKQTSAGFRVCTPKATVAVELKKKLIKTGQS